MFISTHQISQIEILTSNVTVLGGGTFKTWSDEGGALVHGISALIRGAPRSLFISLYAM